jgi:hypothetical protein
MARLIEVAAMDEKLKGLGQNSAIDFNARLLSVMERPPSAAAATSRMPRKGAE